MAPKTIKKLIFDALENLTPLDLEKFIRHLVDRREDPRIRRSRVDGKNFMVVTDAIVSTFCEYKGLLVTLEILKDIDCNEDASRLESEAKKIRPLGVDGHGAASNDGGHFVDIHRAELIQRVALVEPILDVLLHERAIHQEGYNRVLAKDVAQDKMRELYRILANTRSKQIFLQALRDKEPMLVEDLEGLQ